MKVELSGFERHTDKQQLRLATVKAKGKTGNFAFVHIPWIVIDCNIFKSINLGITNNPYIDYC